MSKPQYANLADKGKSDPYHTELTESDMWHLALLEQVRKFPGAFTAEDLIVIIEAMEEK